MSIFAKTGSFITVANAAVGYKHYIRGIGFKPKVVMLWNSGAQSLGDTVTSAAYSIGFGVAIDSTHRFCSSSMSIKTWAEASTRRVSDTELMCIWNPTGDPNNMSIAGRLDFSQMRNDGFDVVVNQQFYSNTYKVSYLALGGSDLTDAYIGKATMPITTGNYDVTGIGFQPDFIMVSGPDYTSIPVGSWNGFMQLGWTSGASNQGIVSFACNNGSWAEVTASYGYNEEILSSASIGLTNMPRRETFVEFLSDGFRLNNLEGTDAFQYMYLALKGGKYYVGDITTRTDTNDIVETVDFRPRVLIFNSVCRPMSTQDISSTSAAMSIGAATTPTNGVVHSIWDGVEGYWGMSYATYDNKIYANVKTGAIVGIMELKSIDPTGFTCAMSDADDAECWVSYLAIGDTADNIDYVHAFIPPKLPEYEVLSSKHAYMNTVGQHFSAKVGSFNIGTNVAGGDISITGLEFQPSLILFWWDGGISTDENIVGSNTNFGFAAAISSSNQMGCEYMSEDAQDISDTIHWQYNQDYTFRMFADTSDWDTQWSFENFQYNGFTISYYGFEVAAIPYRINYLALQGIDITNTKVNYKQFFNSIGNHAFTGIGFKPDALIFVSSINYSINNYTSPGQFMIGMATGVNNQGVISIYAQDNVGTTNTKSYCSNAEVTVLSGANVNNRNTFVSFDTDGFTLNTLEAGSTYYFFYIALKGGKYHVGNFNTKTDGSDISVTNCGFPPKAALLFSNNRPLSTQDTASDHASMSIGGFSSVTDRVTAAMWDENGLDISEVAHAKYDTAVYANIKDDAVQGLMDIKSIDEDGFTCVMDDTDPAENFITYIAFGGDKPAFIRSSKSAYIYGHDPNGLEVRAYMHGIIYNFATSNHAFMAGGLNPTTSIPAYMEGINLTLATKAGSFNINTSLNIGETQSIADIGFRPKLVLFWLTGTKNNEYPTYWEDENYVGDGGDDFNFGFGAAIDSTHRFGTIGYTEANTIPTVTYHSQNNTEILRTYIPSGVIPTIDGILDFYSMDSGGFTVIVDDTFSSEYRVSYLAIGGDDLTDVYIGNTALPTASGIFDVTDVGFQPGAIIAITQLQTSAIEESSHALMSLGWASDSGQGVNSYINVNNVSTTSALSYGYNNQLYAPISAAGAIDCKGEFIEFLSNGFRLNHLKDSSAYQLYYIAIKGGTFITGSTHSLADYNQTDFESSIGVKPTGILFSSPVNYLSTVDTPVSDAFFSLGAATLLGQAAQGIFAYNGKTYISLYTSSINTGYYTNGDYASGLILLSFDDSGWTFQAPDWWYDPDQYWINYLAIGTTIRLNINSNTSAYTEGVGLLTSSKHAYLAGGSTDNTTSVPAYMNTILGSLTSVHAYTYGVASVTSISAYMYGQVNIVTAKHVYMLATQVPIYGPLVWTS